MIEAVVYRSNTGFTRRYAQMLAARAGVEAYDLNAARRAVRKGAPVAYLGWVMAGRVSGLKKACARFDVRVACAVGMSPAGGEAEAYVRRQNPMPAGRPLFCLQGGMVPERLGFAYRAMIGMMAKGLADKKERTAEEELLLTCARDGGDCVAEDNLAPVVRALFPNEKERCE